MVLRQIEIQKFKKLLSTLSLGVSINIRAGPEIRLEAGGKPSTWFPPGRLVEHLYTDNGISNSDSKSHATI